MRLINYNLQVGNRVLIKDLNLTFEKNVIHHLLGSNGSGKSSFAKSCVGILKFSGQIEGNENSVLLGNSSNVPSDFCLVDIIKILSKKFGKDKTHELYELLKLGEVAQSLPVGKMSDGQKQKTKLFAFLSANPLIIIFDEFTTALDKKSSLDLYAFLSDYVAHNPITLINITHNVSDIEYLAGKYYYLHNLGIIQIATKEKIIDAYVKGGVE